MSVMRWTLILLLGVGLASAEESADLLRGRDRLRQVVSYAQAHPELFPTEKVRGPRMLAREQKEAVWSTWKTFLDCLLSLDKLGRDHRDFYKHTGAERDRDFRLCHGAFVAEYRAALEFLHLTDNDPGFDKLLNEPVPELGLPRDTYRLVKFRFLNVARSAEFAAGEAVMKTFGVNAAPELRDDARVIWKMGKGRGEVLTAKNGLTMLRRAGFTAWFPVQMNVSEWMGDTRMVRREHGLISREQIAALVARLEPGDIILERRNWYVSNIGLPGFWPHTAIYAGVADGKPRVLEAISEGVCYNSLEHSLDADSVAVLRPRLSKAERATALQRAMHYIGRPYDFNFDFLTDAELVCSELVYKAYEPGKDFRGVRFALTEMLGRHLLPPNEIVRQFDEGKLEADFVAFLDGREQKRCAVEADVEEFRKSWRRPKWHVPLQTLNMEDRP